MIALVSRKFLFAYLLIGLFFLYGVIAPNISTAAGPNLIQNPSLENDADANAIPDQWFKGSWGSNSVVFTYPVGGISGRAGKIDLSAYSNGDAKWYFADVSVTAGEEYMFKDQYVSNTSTTLTVRYTNASGTFTYLDLATLPASASPATVEKTFTVPEGMVSVTVLHLIKSNGSLTVDNFSLSKNTATTTLPIDPTGFNSGFVSLTFDDGWISHFTNAKPILDAANIKGTFYIISGALAWINNSSLENDLDNNNVPDGWTGSKSGNNTATFSYPVAGANGSRVAKINVSAYKNGEAKWIFNEIPIKGGWNYTFSDQYVSTVSTKVVAQMRKADGSIQTMELGTLAASPVWKYFKKTFSVPIDAKTITIYQAISANGSLTVDNFKLVNASGFYMNQTHLLGLQNAGHEIGNHTRTHPSLTSLTTDQALAEIDLAKTDLLAMGANTIKTLAYPFGDYNDSLKQMIKNAGMSSARSVDRGFNTKDTDKYALKIQQVDNTTTLDQIKTWIDQVNVSKTWLILMFHQIDYSKNQYSTTPEILQGVVNYIKSTDTPSRTITEGLSLLI
ncbi:MAG: hypothetical protein A2836_01855 [Candidatus Taylorbacteria bacterium RIFCSPHIGHO2_01_FULL_45_63]|uniref:NodB homology domain-containing protein n=1 Tax=Candidatus Taylorbacteria bacterium RIFCSPHIGHO2_02_FULL_45_35 TaxID=1802311 RepID=A0A1G2MR80_9BACT|nr:MAG: hypothetical protein A2836_01855 [Candidatus Taylorbacteria bacterium RIFCSPHIGHO2_01_FULL_45_63]OHA26363.1 MAG: hypothetical protein A3D56_03760 [Candidatus Taylorbacteria bacterium RIFCSPHIGHO2_02_FULL_45_35]